LLQYGTYPGRAVAFSETFVTKPEVCHSIEETVRDIDGAFIADSSSPKDGADHLALAKPFLESGIPLFVDKPFAATLADALEMVRLAQAYKTPLMNASLLSYTAVGDFFRRRFEEIGQPGFLTVKGVGFTNGAVGHGLALALAMFGFGVESVECMGATPDPAIGHWNRASRDYRLEHILLHYPDGRQAIVMNTDHRWYPQTSEFYCSVYSRQGALHSPGIGDREFLTGGTAIINLFKQMIDTKQPPIPYSHILEPFAIIEAARIAQKERRRVMLSEVWGEKTNEECA
ncbi:MAG: Gfo/Idh/MocA family oxidoreductase, partial [Armatimonadetes bacterium]|nr:Gfo/Idh/MocA family oxidoreductase [Armatimonadota bacterium]